MKLNHFSTTAADTLTKVPDIRTDKFKRVDFIREN